MTCPGTRHHSRDAALRYGCQCPDARQAAVRYWKWYRVRKITGELRIVDGTGTRRRIRALQAQGWPGELLAERLGVTPQRVSRLALAKQVHVDSARSISDLYNELAEQPGPSETLRKRAVTLGWLGPGWWDDSNIDDPTYTPPTEERRQPQYWELDEVAVERAIQGREVDLTRAERLEAIRRLKARNVTHLEIARRLRQHPRQVLRDLREMAAA